MNPDTTNQPNEQPEMPQQPVAPPQPQQPAQPMQPAQPQPMFQPQPAPMTPGSPMNTGGSSNKKLFIIIGAIVGGLLLIGLIIILALTMSGVSKKDYKDAYDTAGTLRSAYTKESSAYVSAYSTETEISNNVDDIKSAHKDVTAAYDKLKNMKAIKNDKEVKKDFDALATKYSDYQKDYDVKIEAYEKVMPLIAKMNNMKAGSKSEALASLKGLKTDFDSIQVTQDVNKTFVTSVQKNLNTLVSLAEKMVAGDSSVLSDYYDTTDEFSNAARDWQSNIKKLDDKADIYDQISKLSTTLFDKYIKKK